MLFVQSRPGKVVVLLFQVTNMNFKYVKYIFPILVMLLLLDMASAGSLTTANSYAGGIPLTTVQKGTVSGGLWYDSYPGFATPAQKIFVLPAYTDVKWARLYVTVSDGHMKENRRGKITIDIDANGDGKYELQKHETFNTSYSFPGEGGKGPVWVNNHMNRVTSDYLMWYDLKNTIKGNKVNVKAATSKIDSSFDGRIKAMTLIIAYNDGDADQVNYWINQGHDTVNPDDTSYTGSTAFGTSKLTDGWKSAKLTAIYLSSVDGNYKFRGNKLASGVKSGPYYGANTWDVGKFLTAGKDSKLTYDKHNHSSYYKIPLAFLSVRYSSTAKAPVAAFSASPRSGKAPLKVQFTDKSTNNPTSWKWSFGDGAYSTVKNPVHKYSKAGKYTVSLTVKNAKGSNTKTISRYIVVTK